MDSQDKQTVSNNNWFRYYIAIVLTFVSVSSGIFFGYLSYKSHARAVNEQKIKELVASFASEWKEKEKQVFSAYTHLRFLVANGKLSRDAKNVQRLLAENIFKAVVGGLYPDRDIPKDEDAFRRIQIIDNLVGTKKSPEVVFTGILLIKDNKKAIEELGKFIRKNPRHWLIPWAYYNLASTCYEERKINLADNHLKSFIDNALNFKYNDNYIVEMRRRIMKKKESIKKLRDISGGLHKNNIREKMYHDKSSSKNDL